jgi:4-hydroxythreonine-4-phosphate dehydrogenase
MLAEKTGAPEVAMMLAGGEFRVVLATTHCPLAEVPPRLTEGGLFRLFQLTCQALDRDFGLAGARLGVAALNPHAGEGGMFGREEEEIIAPAVRRAQEAGLPVDGPFPADTLFWRHRQGEFAAIVCMYHDQGLIPLKILHFMNSVNVTLGLPIIRTSVDHGTAYNLAGTGQAASASLKAAIRMAAEMAKRRFGKE